MSINSSYTNKSNITSELLYSNYAATLADTSELDSGWLDVSGVDKIQFSGRSDTAGLNLVIDSRGDSSQTVLTTNTIYSDGPFFLFNVPARQNEMRFRWQNNTGGSVNDVTSEVKATYGSSDKLSVFPVGVQPSDFSQAALVQSVLRGQEPVNGTYKQVQVNQSGAMLTSDFGTEVSRGLYEGTGINVKFGRNSDIDIGTPEDVWEGGGIYTGFPTSEEAIQVFSSSGADVGSVLSTEVATSGTSTTMTSIGATFVSSGVTVGDVMVNDTKGEHGIISNVTEDTLTVYSMSGGVTNEAGDNVRVVTNSSTGVSLIRLQSLLDGNFIKQTDVYVVTNGVTSVSTPLSNYTRCSRVKAIHAGSGGVNAGNITVRQATTTTNVYSTMQVGYGQSTVSATSTPSDKIYLIKSIDVEMARSNGSAGSAVIQFLVRERGGAWNAKRVYDVTDSVSVNTKFVGGIVVNPMSDIKVRVTSVSDNNTSVEASFEYFIIDI
jgi:hypothetical protein